MKLVYVMYHYPSVGGEGCRSIEQLKLLSKLFDVTLISLFDDPAEKLEVPKGLEIIRLSKEKRKVSLYSALSPTSLISSFQGNGDPVTASKLNSEIRETVRKEVMKQKPNVVIARNPTMIYALKDLKQPNQFFLGDAVDSMQRFFQSMVDYGDFYLKPAALTCKYLAKKSEMNLSGFDLISFITESDKKHFSGNIKTEVLPNIKHKMPKINPKKKFDAVLFASWSYYPNHHGLKYFSKKILPLLQNYSIAIIGKLPENINSILEKYDNLTLTGHLNDSDFNETVASSKVSISPVLLGAGEQNKILDALGLGIPVISTPLYKSNLSSPVAIANTPKQFQKYLEKIVSMPQSEYSVLSKQSENFYLSYVKNSKHVNETFFNNLKNSLSK